MCLAILAMQLGRLLLGAFPCDHLLVYLTNVAPTLHSMLAVLPA